MAEVRLDPEAPLRESVMVLGAESDLLRAMCLSRLRNNQVDQDIVPESETTLTAIHLPVMLPKPLSEYRYLTARACLVASHRLTCLPPHV